MQHQNSNYPTFLTWIAFGLFYAALAAPMHWLTAEYVYQRHQPKVAQQLCPEPAALPPLTSEEADSPILDFSLPAKGE